MEMPLRLARVWWTGFKVFCRWCAFGIVLWLFWLPLAGLAYLVDDYVAGSLAFVLAILLAPIPFYFTSKYLRLLDDRDEDTTQDRGSPPEVIGRKGKALVTKVLISMAVAFLCACFLTPPDLISTISLGVPMAFLCGISLLILSRFRFMKSASPSMQTLVCVLACAAAVSSTTCLAYASGVFRL
ncbi:MAG: hypothetical protein ABFE13_14960 [Phycisphaerales bacterium]